MTIRLGHSLSRLAVAGALVLALTACGGDDTGEVTDTTEPSDQSSPDVGDDAGDDGADDADDAGDDAPEGCSAPPTTIELRAADAFEDLPVIEDDAFEVTSTLAVKVSEGAYTMYLADYDLDPEVYSDFTTDHPPVGSTLVTVFITAFGSAEDPFPELEPLAPGQIVPPSTEVSGEQQFNIVIERGTDGGEEGGDLYNSSSGPEGSLEVLAVDDESICVAVDYTDYEGASSTNGVADEYPLQKRLVATFAAPVVEF